MDETVRPWLSPSRKLREMTPVSLPPLALLTVPLKYAFIVATLITILHYNVFAVHWFPQDYSLIESGGKDSSSGATTTSSCTAAGLVCGPFGKCTARSGG